MPTNSIMVPILGLVLRTMSKFPVQPSTNSDAKPHDFTFVGTQTLLHAANIYTYRQQLGNNPLPYMQMSSSHKPVVGKEQTGNTVITLTLPDKVRAQYPR